MMQHTVINKTQFEMTSLIRHQLWSAGNESITGLQARETEQETTVILIHQRQIASRGDLY